MKSIKLYVVLYFLLNLLVTYLLTSSSLNPNIINFNMNITYVISSIIGNIACLLIILVIGLVFIRRKKSLYRYLIIVSLILNTSILLMLYFTSCFKTMLSFHNLTLFRNPNAGFAFQVVLDGLSQIVLNWQFLCFIPFVILLILYFCFKKYSLDKLKIRVIPLMILTLISLILSLSSVLYFHNTVRKNWPFRSDVALYGVSVCGAYNYYFAELLLGLDYTKLYYESIKDKDSNLYLFDKNIEAKNIIDETEYDNSNVGILEGMNLFVIQAEALQSFVVNLSVNNKKIMPYMNILLEEDDVFFFKNMHTSVGLGNTSDAEFVVNTGYYPLGDLTINWEVKDNLFDIQSLPKMFNDGYRSYSYNPTIEGFYAHKYVHENFYNFYEFKGFESFDKKYPYNSNLDLYLHKKWVSDKAILDFALIDGKRTIDEGENFYIFAQTITPHYPFVDLKDYQNNKISVNGVSKKFNNYLSQVNYIDMVLYEFIIKAKQELPNTVFMIYGDHGNTLSKKDYEALYQKKLTDFEYRKILLEVPLIVYDPSGKINDYVSSMNLNVREMSNRVLSQIDIFSTIKSLYNLSCDYTLGVNAFTNQKSFALDPKNLDLITDSFIYNYKNFKYSLYSDIRYDYMIEITNKVKELKIANDVYISQKIGSKS